MHETTTKMITLHFTNMYPVFFCFPFCSGTDVDFQYIFFFHILALVPFPCIFLIIELSYESFNLYNN